MIPDVFHLVRLTSVPLHLTDIKERHMVHREIANRDFSRQFAHPGGDSHHPVQHDPDKGKINTRWWRRLYICERRICYSPVQKTFFFFLKKKNSINFFFLNETPVHRSKWEKEHKDVTLMRCYTVYFVFQIVSLCENCHAKCFSV